MPSGKGRPICHLGMSFFGDHQNWLHFFPAGFPSKPNTQGNSQSRRWGPGAEGPILRAASQRGAVLWPDSQKASGHRPFLGVAFQGRLPKISCWCSVGNEGMRNGMIPINHSLWLPLRESLGSFPHSLLSTSKICPLSYPPTDHVMKFRRP